VLQRLASLNKILATRNSKSTYIYFQSFVKLNCAQGWSPFCDNNNNCACYKYIDTLKTWLQALDHCLSLKSNLASVHSLEEIKFLDDLSHNATTLPWIGLRLVQNFYQWSDGTKLDFTFWRDVEPNIVRHKVGEETLREDCTQMATSAYARRYISNEKVPEVALRWNDFLCEKSNLEPFFCKST